MSNEITPKEAVDGLSLTEIEDLALKHMKHDNHVIRHRGQVEIARELRALATSNIADILEEDESGVIRVKALKDMPREVTAAIKKIKVKRDRIKAPKTINEDGDIVGGHQDLTGEVVEIELWDKTSALDKLMRHYGGYAEDNRQLAEANADSVGANLDLLLGAISGQGLPQLKPEGMRDQSVEIDYDGEEDL